MATESTPQPPVEQQTPPEAPQQVQPAPVIQYVVQKQSLEGIGGWLIFWLIIFGLNALGALWMFIGGLIGLVESGSSGVALALIIETMVFGLLMAASATSMVVFTGLRKKLGVLFAYISLGVSALYSTAAAITAMFVKPESCSYKFDYDAYSTYSEPIRTCTTESLPAGVIIAYVGAIIVTWLGAFLIGLYFKLSQRVKQTLTR